MLPRPPGDVMPAVDKYHALGNDYLVWHGDGALPEGVVRALCDRHGGPGGDGVLAATARHGDAFGVRIYNPDGSVAEKSGNGLRIYARWLVDQGQAAADQPIALWTGSERVVAWVPASGADVVAEMGTARFEADAVPVDGGLAGGGAVDLGGETVEVVPVGLGNPHAVVFVPDVAAAPWRRWGSALEVHPAFPHRTNVQVATVRADGALDVRIWERGAGPTLASGSSACAAAAAAVQTGRLAAGSMDVHMPGGTVRVAVRPDLSLRLTGPVERVGVTALDDAWWERRTRTR